MRFWHSEVWVFWPFLEDGDGINVEKYIESHIKPTIVLDIRIPPELAEDITGLPEAYACVVNDIERALSLLNNNKKWDRRTSSHYFKCMICLVISRHNIQKRFTRPCYRGVGKYTRWSRPSWQKEDLWWDQWWRQPRASSSSVWACEYNPPDGQVLWDRLDWSLKTSTPFNNWERLGNISLADISNLPFAGGNRRKQIKVNVI